MRRRIFVGTVFSGLAAAQPPNPKSGGIPTRPLGKTGQQLTLIGSGGARFHLTGLEQGVKVVRRAFELGINYFDMARGYWDGRAEEVYGAALTPAMRKSVFVTSKTGKRDAAGALAELETSLRLMRTSWLDLWQLHGVNTAEDVRKILAPGGALEALQRAKQQGKARFVGFTGHADPAFNLELMRAWDGFDTMLMPLHVADPVYLSFEKDALPAAKERGLGVLGMKIFGNAFLLRAFHSSECLRYTLSLPVAAVTLGFTTIGQLDDDVRVAQDFRPLRPEEMDALRARAAGDRFDVIKGPALEYWKRKV